MSRDEIPLTGGNVNPGDVVRVGDTVRRPARPHAEAVHAVLLHLEHVGFDRAPRFLGFDEHGREVLSFIPGVNVWETQHQLLRSPAGVATIGGLLRDVHAALSTYEPPEGTLWPARLRDPSGGTHVIHGDAGPWNLVAEPGSNRCSIIDWENVAPGGLVWELSYTLQTVAHLWDDPPPWSSRVFTEDEILARLRAFGGGYGLNHETLVDCVRFAAHRSQVMADWITAYADQGEPAFVTMRDGGHVDAWAGGARAIERHADAWITRLRDSV